MDLQQLFEQILQQYGLVGFLLAFLVVGPGFTYFKTRNMQVRIESKAQELLTEYTRQERLRADRMENRLDATLEKLETAESEVVTLREQLAEARRDVEQLPVLLRQIEQLTQRVADLENQVQQERTNNQHLLQILHEREQQISRLEGQAEKE